MRIFHEILCSFETESRHHANYVVIGVIADRHNINCSTATDGKVGLMAAFSLECISCENICLCPCRDKLYPSCAFISDSTSWWRHQMGTFSELLALCAGNSPVTGEFPSQRPVPRGFDLFSSAPEQTVELTIGDLRRHRAHYDVSLMWQAGHCHALSLVDPWRWLSANLW